MVLADLGTKMQAALRKIYQASTINEETLTALMKDISIALLSSDVNIKLISTLRKNVLKRLNLKEIPSGVNKRNLIQQTVVSEMVKMVTGVKKPFKPSRKRTNVVMFVGLQGSGKTTSCCKLAHYYKRKSWKVGLICGDTYRAGAFDQLKQNATKINVPFYGSYNQSDPVELISEGMKKFQDDDFEIIIVDTSGRHKQEAALFEEMRDIHSAITPDNVIFVLDGAMGQAAHDQAKAFHEAVSVGSVIVTKLDGSSKGGGALSAVAATGSSICFIGTGEHLDQLEEFRPESFVKRLLGLGDIKGLVDKMKETNQEKLQEQLMQKITRGETLTLRDLKDQFASVLKLGPLSSVMSMIPGLSGLANAGNDKASSQKIQRYLTLMDSMTDEELDSKPSLVYTSESRIRRISMGAGLHPMHLVQLAEICKTMGKAASKMKGMKLKNGQMPTNMNDLNKLSSMIPPHMLKQMGGVHGMKNIMSQLQNDPDAMRKMMAKMGQGGSGKKMMKIRRR